MLERHQYFEQENCQEIAVREVESVSARKVNYAGNQYLNHPLRLIKPACEDTSVNSLFFSRQCSASSNDSTVLENPLQSRHVEDSAYLYNRQTPACAKFNEVNIFNPDDLLVNEQQERYTSN